MSLYTRNILILICLYPWSVKHKIVRRAIDKNKFWSISKPVSRALTRTWDTFSTLRGNWVNYSHVRDVMCGPFEFRGRIVLLNIYTSLPCTGRSKFPELSAVVTPALIWPEVSERRRCSMPSFFFTKKINIWKLETRRHIIKINFHSSSGVHIKVVLDDMVSFC